MESSYLGEFSEEEIENMKRSNPYLDEELGIEIKYIAPLKKSEWTWHLIPKYCFLS